jgi:hypothetical protein
LKSTEAIFCISGLKSFSYILDLGNKIRPGKIILNLQKESGMIISNGFLLLRWTKLLLSATISVICGNNKYKILPLISQIYADQGLIILSIVFRRLGLSTLLPENTSRGAAHRNIYP